MSRFQHTFRQVLSAFSGHQAHPRPWIVLRGDGSPVGGGAFAERRNAERFVRIYGDEFAGRLRIVRRATQEGQ